MGAALTNGELTIIGTGFSTVAAIGAAWLVRTGRRSDRRLAEQAGDDSSADVVAQVSLTKQLVDDQRDDLVAARRRIVELEQRITELGG